MDNVTHTLCALGLARAGLDRLGPLATPTLVISANLPDLDGIVLLTEGQVAYLCQHRGITHALLGLAVETLLVAVVMFAYGRWRGHRVRFGALSIVAGVGFASHLVLDALNTYGVRPFLPFDRTWYYGDTAFIVDPWLLLAFGACAYLGSRRSLAAHAGWIALLGGGAWLMLSTNRAPLTASVAWLAGMLAALGLGLVWARVSVGRRRRTAGTLLALAAGYLLALHFASRAAEGRGIEILRAEIGGAATIETTSCHPAPAVPWRFSVMVQTAADVWSVRSVDLLDDTHGEIASMPRNLEEPALRAVEHTPEYRTWRDFARHPFVYRDGQLLLLGDRRYSPRPEPSWCNLTVRLPEPNGSK